MPIVPASGNWSAEVSRLKAAGIAMPNSPVQARLMAKEFQGTISKGSESTRKLAADMRRSRMRTAMTRTGSDMTIALPKIRQPLSSLMDKGIPWNIGDEKERKDCVHWSRAFYATHDLMPLLIDLYSTFPVTGLELQHDDPLLEKFYTEMFVDDLNYEEFLPDCLLREYFIAGEVTSLAHFNEELGIWSSEEILNPDMVRVSKSLFTNEERVQLLVKELVEGLRQGPNGGASTSEQESPSERLERTWEYQQLVHHYPEIIKAAAQDDGLDISEALWSRLVNRANPWDVRGTPFMLRSFRTLMLEESLNAAQDSVADRLYSPLILATLGIQDMGDGEPWIPDAGELDELREDFQMALAADFKLMCHHFGLQVTPVFGREAVPRFDQDYDRIDAKIMQAWGVGAALIMGGTGAGGTYASSALNREVVEQLMAKAQRKAIQHMKKRMKVIAEAQEHYEYELKGGMRRPVYIEVVEEDPETGERRIVRQPKLAIPEVKFRTLNLRDEATERQFIVQCKQLGFPISDKSLAINLPVDFKQEIQRQGEETVDKLVAEAEAMGKAQAIIDTKKLPYPAELAQFLMQTLQLRTMLAQTDMAEGQAEAMDQQMAQASPAGQLGLLPGTMPQPGMPGGGPPVDEDGKPIGPPDGPQATGAFAGGPDGAVPQQDPTAQPASPEPPRNRSRPPVSDEQRAGAPRAAYRQGRRLSQFETGPSSLGHAKRVNEQQVEAAVTRRDLIARHPVPAVSDLVRDPQFYHLLNSPDQGVIEAEWPEIRAGGAPQATRLLQELVDQYEECTGVRPIWE